MVDLASTNTNPNYAGVLKGDIDGATAGIVAESYVWVSRSGIVTGGGVGTLDLSTFTVGDIVYLDTSANAGDPFRDTDSFASAVAAFPDIMIPAGIVVDNANPGKILVAPGLKYTGAAAVNATFRYKGIGDFSSLRVGRPDGLTIAAEADGTIEVVKEAGENIAQGNVVCISSRGAYIADSSDSVPAGVSFRQDGIFGVAVEAVNVGELGHYTIFGECPNALTQSPIAGEMLYVGSSTSAAGSYEGQLVKRGFIQQPEDDPRHWPTGVIAAPSKAIPVAVCDIAGVVYMGTHQDDGLIHNVRSTKYYTDGEDVAWNSNVLSVDNSNVYHSASVGVVDGIANVNLPDTITDVSADPSSLYEAPIMADVLYDVANDQLGGTSFVGGMDTPGAKLVTAAWNPAPALGTAPNELFGSFALDDRYHNGVNPVKIVVYGYTNNAAAGTIEVDLVVRLNACGQEIDAIALGIYGGAHDSTASATQTAVCLEYPFYEITGGNPENFVGVLDALSGSDVTSIDFTLERGDAVATGFIVTKVVLVSTYLKVHRLDNEEVALYEHHTSGPSLYDVRSADYLVSDQTLGGDHVVGASMSNAIGTGTGEFIETVPLDSRVTDEAGADITVRVMGQYKGGIPVTSLDLELVARFEYCDSEYDSDISVGASHTSTVNQTPAINTSAGNSYEVVCFDFTISAAQIAAAGGFYGAPGMPVLHYRLERTGTNPAQDGVPAVVETFFHITNVSLYQSALVEHKDEIFENHNVSVFAINGITGTDNHTVVGDGLGDYAGFRMTSGGTEMLVAAVDFDKRYNERDFLEVTVTGVVAAAGDEVSLALRWASLYCSGEVPALAGYNSLLTDDVDTSGYAANVRTVCHKFYLSAYQLWEDNTPPTGAPINHNSLMIQIVRGDSSGQLYTALSVSVESVESKRVKPFDGFINISEDRTAEDRTRLLIPGGSRHDFTKDILLSTQRYTWTYGLDGSSGAIAPGNSLALQPSGIPSSALISGRKPGYLIPYNIAIVGVFGWFEDFTDNTVALTTCDLQLGIYEVPALTTGSASKNNESGIYHFPLTVTIDDSDNSCRWTGNPLNIEPSDSENLPLVYLPSDYSDAGTFIRWLLTLEFHNGHGGNSYDPIGNVMVEVALLPTAE